MCRFTRCVLLTSSIYIRSDSLHDVHEKCVSARRGFFFFFFLWSMLSSVIARPSLASQASKQGSLPRESHHVSRPRAVCKFFLGGAPFPCPPPLAQVQVGFWRRGGSPRGAARAAQPARLPQQADLLPAPGLPQLHRGRCGGVVGLRRPVRLARGGRGRQSGGAILPALRFRRGRARGRLLGQPRARLRALRRRRARAGHRTAGRGVFGQDDPLAPAAEDLPLGLGHGVVRVAPGGGVLFLHIGVAPRVGRRAGTQGPARLPVGRRPRRGAVARGKRGPSDAGAAPDGRPGGDPGAAPPASSTRRRWDGARRPSRADMIYRIASYTSIKFYTLGLERPHPSYKLVYGPVLCIK